MVYQTPLVKVMLQEMSTVAKFCYERGWSYGTAGNFSVRSQGMIWQSPTGWCKGILNPHSFLPVDVKTGASLLEDGRRPSAEMPVHLGIYRAKPDARCVVHSHPVAVVRKSKQADALVFEGDELAKHLGLSSHRDRLSIPLYENPSPDEMRKIAQEAQNWAEKSVLSKMVVLKGHGVYAWGATPFEALSYLEALEHLCLL